MVDDSDSDDVDGVSDDYVGGDIDDVVNSFGAVYVDVSMDGDDYVACAGPVDT